MRILPTEYDYYLNSLGAIYNWVYDKIYKCYIWKLCYWKKVIEKSLKVFLLERKPLFYTSGFSDEARGRHWIYNINTGRWYG